MPTYKYPHEHFAESAIKALSTAATAVAYGTSTTMSTAALPTFEEIHASIKEVYRTLGPEPIAAWMRSKGCPEDEYILMLPLEDYQKIEFPPNYVRTSPLCISPIFMKRDLFEPVGVQSILRRHTTP